MTTLSARAVIFGSGNRGVSFPFFATATPVDYTTSNTILVNGADYEVDWGDGVFTPQTANNPASSVASNSGSGIITVRSVGAPIGIQFVTNTYLAIDMPETSTLINCINMCSNLTNMTSFTAPVTAFGNAERLDAAWSSCNSLTSFPTIDTSSVTNLSSTWFACTSLLAFPALDVGSCVNFQFTWNSCFAMETIGALNTTGTTPSFLGTFQNSFSLTCITSIDTTAHTGTTDMFAGTTALVAPDGTEQTALLAGADYVNAGDCPSSDDFDIGTGIVPLPGSTTSYDAGDAGGVNANVNTSGIAFSSDGTKMFTLGQSNQLVHQFTLGTAWDITSTSYDSKSFNVSTQHAQPQGISFSPDGANMFIIGGESTISQYTVSAAWDIGVGGANVSHLASGATSTGSWGGMHFNATGTKVTVMHSVHQIDSYPIGTPWTISTIGAATGFTNISAQDSSGSGVHVSPDGSILNTVGGDNDSIYKYLLSPAFDETSASHDATMDIGAIVGFPRDLKFNTNGTIMYVPDSNTGFIHQIPVP